MAVQTLCCMLWYVNRLFCSQEIHIMFDSHCLSMCVLWEKMVFFSSQSKQWLFEQLIKSARRHRSCSHTHTCQEGKVCAMKTCLWSGCGRPPPPLFAEPHGSYLISQQGVFWSVTIWKLKGNPSLCRLLRLCLLNHVRFLFEMFSLRSIFLLRVTRKFTTTSRACFSPLENWSWELSLKFKSSNYGRPTTMWIWIKTQNTWMNFKARIFNP